MPEMKAEERAIIDERARRGRVATMSLVELALNAAWICYGCTQSNDIGPYDPGKALRLNMTEPEFAVVFSTILTVQREAVERCAEIAETAVGTHPMPTVEKDLVDNIAARILALLLAGTRPQRVRAGLHPGGTGGPS